MFADREEAKGGWEKGVCGGSYRWWKVDIRA
jgi:hypothetical protein